MTAVATLEGAGRCLSAITDVIRPWEEREGELSELIGYPAYLGGDGLRPYALWQDERDVYLLTVSVSEGVPEAPLVTELRSGRFGIGTVTDSGADWQCTKWARTPALDARLEVPSMVLIGLGDAERYRGARLALGVARLGQWLRYSHSARVVIRDYNLLEDPLGSVTETLHRVRPDIVGISVNFGQWHQLAELNDVVNALPLKALVLGNILAAYDPTRAADGFAATAQHRVLVATSLGERPLQQLCSRLDDPASWDSIPGLIRPESPVSAVPNVRAAVPDLVFPDDGLVHGIIERHGQISFETSFGCNFGACTFCPRDHRGEGWSRGHLATVTAALGRVARAGAVLSIVDEEFFGFEGLEDPPAQDLPAERILSVCQEHGVEYEIYTRLEQIFDRRRSRAWIEARATMLAREAPHMRRIFVGVESGSGRQLRRYGKGQTVRQIVDSLRVGSALGIPMEFGFITFDPLITPSELAENIAFLGRRDIINQVVEGTDEARVQAVLDYLDGQEPFTPSEVPLYQHVAYMATELEVLGHSRYANTLRRRHPHLLTGTYDSSFARYDVVYDDERIGEVAGWCRVWTEGMFAPVYECRMEARSGDDPEAVTRARRVVERYRDVTFTLLLEVTIALVPELSNDLQHLVSPSTSFAQPNPQRLSQLAQEVLGSDQDVTFDSVLLTQRRTR